MGAQNVPTQDEPVALCLALLKQTSSTLTSTSTSTCLMLPHECSICGKAFSSYQALGGHKSSHRRPPTGLEIEFIKPMLSSVPSRLPAGAPSHQCNVCYKTFSTGQALGGHKRCHYWDTSSSTSAHYSGAKNTASSSSVRDFDLNLPAFDFMDEEEEVQSPHLSPKC